MVIKKTRVPYWCRGALILMGAYLLLLSLPGATLFLYVPFYFAGTVSGLHTFLFMVFPALGNAGFLWGVYTDTIVQSITLLYLGFVGALWGNIYKNWRAKDKESKRIKKISLIIYLVLVALTIISQVMFIIGFSGGP